MKPLLDVIATRIRERGRITFREYMEMALYEPGLGYYARRDTIIGRAGDFYTSPHLHPLFGAMIGRQVIECWEVMGRPARFDVIEFGPGQGHLAHDMLSYLKSNDIFPSLTYTLVELNPWMKDRQGELLHEFSSRIRWAASYFEIQDARGCIVSNELIDAFPVHLVVMQDELKEIYVTLREGDLAEETAQISTQKLMKYLNVYGITFGNNYKSEINLGIEPWVRGIAGMLREGFVVTIDYGYPTDEYYRPERYRGTLQCYRKHSVSENPLEHVGEQDITAHVNFSSLMRCGEEYGLECLGFTRQGTYLLSLGLDETIVELFGNSTGFSGAALAAKGLILPEGMGESHKVMVQYRGPGRPELRGFALKNQLGTL